MMLQLSLFQELLYNIRNDTVHGPENGKMYCCTRLSYPQLPFEFGLRFSNDHGNFNDESRRCFHDGLI